jgi:hypothetical protein
MESERSGSTISHAHPDPDSAGRRRSEPLREAPERAESLGDGLREVLAEDFVAARGRARGQQVLVSHRVSSFLVAFPCETGRYGKRTSILPPRRGDSKHR